MESKFFANKLIIGEMVSKCFVMNKKPLVSVVIPTHNRFELLKLAVQSVLNQTHSDFEIIVSDNYSTDATNLIVEEFSDSRIKYFRSEKMLSLGDSWEFALTHATGEYVGFLSDDDAYAKVYLETMLRILEDNKAEIAATKITSYYSKNFKEYGRNIEPNSLVLLPYSRKLSVLDKDEAVTFLFSKFNLTVNSGFASSVNIPQLVNTIYHSSLIKKVKDRVGKLLPIVGSDIYTAALFLNVADKYCYIDEPLYLHNTWEGSSTAGDQSMFEKYPEEKQLDYVPLKKLLTLSNYGKNAILRARADWGSDFYPVNIDWKTYFATSYKEIMYEKVYKRDVSQQLDEFQKILSEQDGILRSEIELEISKYSFYREALKRTIKQSILGKIALNLKNKNIRVLDGKDNIVDCANLIDDSFLAKYSER